MLTLSYRIALLLSFSFFQYVKDRYLMHNYKFIIKCLTTPSLNVLIYCVSMLINLSFIPCSAFRVPFYGDFSLHSLVYMFLLFIKKTTRLLFLILCSFVLVPGSLLTSYLLTSYLFLISVENKGLEPLTPCVQGRCSKPTELIPRF
jgi:hypothetical protein